MNQLNEQSIRWALKQKDGVKPQTHVRFFENLAKIIENKKFKDEEKDFWYTIVAQYCEICEQNNIENWSKHNFNFLDLFEKSLQYIKDKTNLQFVIALNALAAKWDEQLNIRHTNSLVASHKLFIIQIEDNKSCSTYFDNDSLPDKRLICIHLCASTSPYERLLICLHELGHYIGCRHRENREQLFQQLSSFALINEVFFKCCAKNMYGVTCDSFSPKLSDDISLSKKNRMYPIYLKDILEESFDELYQIVLKAYKHCAESEWKELAELGMCLDAIQVHLQAALYSVDSFSSTSNLYVELMTKVNDLVKDTGLKENEVDYTQKIIDHNVQIIRSINIKKLTDINGLETALTNLCGALKQLIDLYEGQYAFYLALTQLEQSINGLYLNHDATPEEQKHLNECQKALEQYNEREINKYTAYVTKLQNLFECLDETKARLNDLEAQVKLEKIVEQYYAILYEKKVSFYFDNVQTAMNTAFSRCIVEGIKQIFCRIAKSEASVKDDSLKEKIVSDIIYVLDDMQQETQNSVQNQQYGDAENNKGASFRCLEDSRMQLSEVAADVFMCNIAQIDAAQYINHLMWLSWDSWSFWNEENSWKSSKEVDCSNDFCKFLANDVLRIRIIAVLSVLSKDPKAVLNQKNYSHIGNRKYRHDFKAGKKMLSEMATEIEKLNKIRDKEEIWLRQDPWNPQYQVTKYASEIGDDELYAEIKEVEYAKRLREFKTNSELWCRIKQGFRSFKKICREWKEKLFDRKERSRSNTVEQ